MDVHLLVYDLSQGLARDMSMSMLGFHLDAIYHTSIQLNGLEYVYDGGIKAIHPGSSHLGSPMQQIPLGRTELPMDVIGEYLDSVREIFTAQAYDLFKHNCNNFTDSFSKFLLGKGIPEHIVNMPDAVLQSPLGRMILPQLAQRANAASRQNGLLGIQGNAPQSFGHRESKVKVVSNLRELDAALDAAKKSCAIVFFTSATCGPCRALYPLYDELSAEVANKGSLIKVDISQAQDVGSKYSIKGTPTFITFLRGEKESEWMGADPAKLRGNVGLLVQMAWPRHPHEGLYLPSFADPSTKPSLYGKVAPLPKLMAKMGDTAKDPVVQGLTNFLETRSNAGPAEAVLPDMAQVASFMQRSLKQLPVELVFTIVDLLRCCVVDPRVSGYFAEERDHATIQAILKFAISQADCPYSLRLMTLQMTCNLFSSPLFGEGVLSSPSLRACIVQLVSSSFLDDSHANVRVATSSLVYNLALSSGKARREGTGETLPEDDEVEIAASVLEAIAQEEASADALRRMLLALGQLAYCTPLDGQLADLLCVMDAEGTIAGKKKQFPGETLVAELGLELLGKGLRKP